MKRLLLILILIAGSLVLYGQKIADLTRATSATKTDLLIIDQSDATKGIAVQHLFSGDSLFLPDLATPDVKVLSPTSTGGTTVLETADGSEITWDTLDVDYIEANSRILVGDGTQALPGISFISDPNTGFRSSGSDQIKIVLGADDKWLFVGSNFYGDNSQSPQITNAAPTSTTPRIISNHSDPNTGLGWAGADLGSYIAGGKEGIRIDGAVGGIEITLNDTVYVDGVINFAADEQADDDYEISLPGVSALVTGLTVTFIATTANTDGATLEITEVGDLDAILKMHDQALVTGDIEAGQVVVCVFDGTNWQMTSQTAQ